MTKLSAVPSDWMSSLDDNLKLTEICLPGAHDAGMYEVGHLLSGLFLTQSLSLMDQMKSGVRYFDLRPRWVNDQFRIYHGEAKFGEVAIGDGPEVLAVLKHLAEFIKAHPTEVVIANFSHFMDIAGPVAVKFMDLVHEHLGRYLPDTNRFPVLSFAPLQELRGKVIVMIADHNVYREGVHRIERTGYCTHENNDWFPYLPMLDDYSNKQDYEAMLADQTMKFNRFSSTGKLFMLNWTLTPNSLTQGVEDLAEKANPHLFSERQQNGILRPNVHGRIVNIINADYIQGHGLKVLDACQHVMEQRLLKSNRTIVYLTSVATGMQLKVDGRQVKPAAVQSEQSHQWIIETVEGSPTLRRFTSTLNGLRLDGNEKEIYLHEPNSGTNQCWHRWPVAGGDSDFLVNCKTNLALDGNKDSIYPHSQNSGEFQKWRITEEPVEFPPGKSSLKIGERLNRSDVLISANRQYKLKMQDDGNLVLYTPRETAQWSSGTHGTGVECAFLEPHGDLVLGRMDGTVLWRLSDHTVRFVPRSDSELVIEDDGQLMIRTGKGERLWTRYEYQKRDTLSSGSRLEPNQGIHSPNGRYDLIMQTDGNLVMYDYSRPRWAAGVQGQGDLAVLETDGNLVIYRKAHQVTKVTRVNDGFKGRDIVATVTVPQGVIWDMHGHDKSWPNRSGSSLRIFNDGKLALLDKEGKEIWSRT